MRANVLRYAVAAALAIGGTAFVAFAGYLALLELVAPQIAALLTGVALFLLALATVLARRLAGKHDEHRLEDAPPDDIEAALRKHIDSLLSVGIRSHPVGAAASTLLLGIAAGYGGSASRSRDSGSKRSRHRAHRE